MDRTVEGLGQNSEELGRFTLERKTITLVSGATTQSCLSGATGKYEISAPQENVVALLLQSDECPLRRYAPDVPQVFDRVTP
jgi:hypothetical protein